MELKDIKAQCKEIAELIGESKRDLIYRNYDTFLDLFGMSNRRNFELLKKVDYQLKKQNITLWSGKEQYASVSDFKRGETITFRLDQNNQSFEKEGMRKVENMNAGTIKILNEKSPIILRKHQESAINQLQNKITKTGKNPFEGLLVLPTGGGKTLTIAYWTAINYLDQNKKVLWIAHRHELLEQAKGTFQERLAFNDIFKTKTSFNYRIISGIHDKPVNIKPSDDLIISSKDSLNAGFDFLDKNWLKGNDEVLLIIDEAHHSTAKTYRTLINKLKGRVSKFTLVGLTATPFRTSENEKGLLAKVFADDIIYKVDLRTLISRGFLSEPVFEEIKTNFDMTTLLTEKQVDDLKYFDIDKIGEATAKTIAENDARNWIIVNQYKNHREKYKQTIVFALNKDNAIALKALFVQAGIKAEFVLSSIQDKMTGVTVSSKGNKLLIDQFRRGELDVLINVNILTEGTDLPNVQSIFLARPTISATLMTQMIGRGLRGLKAGGTKEAYIVSFIDDWKNQVNWVNPEKLIIQENIDFDDTTKDIKKQLIRLVSINKIEEFAILTNEILDQVRKEELEKLSFIERIPVGIYHFSILNQSDVEEDEELEKNCEILVYDNIQQSYIDFINGLHDFFKQQHLTERTSLSETELETLAKHIIDQFFYGCVKYPGYNNIQDIKDVLQYFAQKAILPKFIALKDRSKYDILHVADEILQKNLGRKDEEDYKSNLWESNETEWKAFFGYDQKYFLNEIDLSIRKLSNPELYKRFSVIPTDEKELVDLERLSMSEIREVNPEYWKYLSDSVYNNHKDDDGFYVSSTKEYKSKNKLDFQIDHIESRHNGGLTRLENLQLLTRKENAKKGSGS